MKEKIVGIIFFLLSICSFAMSKKNNGIEVEGYIKMYGNEPFSYPCIIDSNDKLYKIESSLENLNALSLLQSKKVRISGDFINYKNKNNNFVEFNDGTIILESWSVVE